MREEHEANRVQLEQCEILQDKNDCNSCMEVFLHHDIIISCHNCKKSYHKNCTDRKKKSRGRPPQKWICQICIHSNITLNSDVSVDTSVVSNVTVQDDQSIASHQETDAGNGYLFSNFSIRTLSEFEYFAGLGIDGENIIPRMSAVSLEYPIPQKFKEQGTEAIKKYLAIRTEKIELHNRNIKEQAFKEAEDFKKKSRGLGQVQCPLCSKTIAWGNIVLHMTSKRLCKNSKM